MRFLKLAHDFSWLSISTKIASQSFFIMNFYFSHLQRVLSLAVVFSALSFSGAFAKTPEIFKPYLKEGSTVAGEIGAIMPPEEINKFIIKVQEAAKADPEWHQEYAKTAQPGVPLPWHEKLGLTNEEYEEYLKLWDKREFKTVHKVTLKLEEAKPGEWMIRVSGAGMPVTLLRYFTESGNFRSPNGELQRIEDVDADARTILGAWKGQEWKYERLTDFISTKENFALGKFADGKHCLLIYRLQENASGRRLANKSMVIRFAPPKK